MAQVVFRSKHASLRIHFDPSRFGMMDAVDGEIYERDNQGRLVTVLVGDPGVPTPVRRKVSKPAAQFADSMLVLQDDDEHPMQRTMIADLRKFIDGTVKAKDGTKCFRPDELWEEDNHTTDVLAQLSGTVILTLPGKFSEEDLEVLKGLEGYFHNAIPRPALNSAMALLDGALARFKVRGIASPVPDRAVKQLRPRIIELVYAIEDTCEQLKRPSPFELEPRERNTNGSTEVVAQPSA